MRSRTVLFLFLVASIVFNARYAIPAYTAADAWLANADHRLPNMRIIPENCRAPFVRRFIAAQEWTDRTLVVLGDSQPYNNGIPTQNTWPSLLAEALSMDAINLAVIDGQLADSAYIARQISQPAGIAVLNINQSHFTGHDIRRIPEVAWTPFEFERCTLVMRRQLAGSDLPFPDDTKAREHYVKIPLDQNRYAMQLRPDVIRDAAVAISNAASRPVMFATPNNLSAFPSYNYPLDDFLQKSATICPMTGIECYDLSGALGPDNFSDIVHLNTPGNKAFAGELSRRLGAVGAEPKP
jgi:hypothetical protein